MPVNIQSVIVSFFTFLQNIGSTIGKLPLPENIKKVINFFKDAFDYCLAFLPYYTGLQVRSQFVLVTVGAFLALDIIFTWFKRTFLENLFHFVDIIMIGVFGYVLALVTIDSNTTLISAVFSCVVYYVVRVYFRYRRVKKEGEIPSDNILRILADASSDRYDFFVTACADITTGFVWFGLFNERGQDRQEVTNKLKKILSNSIPTLNIPRELNKEEKRSLYLNFIVGVISISFGLLCSGTFGSKKYIPAVIQIIVPWICYFIGAVLILHTLISTGIKGRRFLFESGLFFKRWGLKAVLLLLNISYVPILNYMAQNFLPGDGTLCESAGEYPVYNLDTSNPVDMFTSHNFTECTACTYNSTSYFCNSMCDYSDSRVGFYDTDLRYVDDILSTTALPIIFAGAYVLFGIPLLFYDQIKKNIYAIEHISFYGENNEEKWRRAMNRLSSSGVFTFSPFKRQYVGWSIVLMMGKLAALVFQTVSVATNSSVYIANAVIYFILFVLTLRCMPYLSKINNFLDALLHFGNLVFAVIPIVNEYITIKDSIYLAITVVSFSFPSMMSVLVLLISYFCSSDETYITNPNKAMKKSMEMIIEKKLDIINEHFLEHERNTGIAPIKEKKCCSGSYLSKYCAPSRVIDMSIDFPVFADSDEGQQVVLVSEFFNPVREFGKKSPVVNNQAAANLANVAAPNAPYAAAPNVPYVAAPNAPYAAAPNVPYVAATDAPYAAAPNVPYVAATNDPNQPYGPNVKSASKYLCAITFMKMYLLADYVIDSQTLSRASFYLSWVAKCGAFVVGFYASHVYIQYKGMLEGGC